VRGEGADAAPFEAHLELLHAFLARRDDIVARIAELLNAQRLPAEYLQDRALQARQLDECFFSQGLTEAQARLRGQLLAAHWASGFKPHEITGLHNDIVDPAELMLRGFHCWRLTRWPGRNGRVRYAETLFNLHLLRCLALLSMRVLDAGPAAGAGPADNAGNRLAKVQALLDALWKSAPADQPVLVRDARWLIPLTQSPTTLELGAYLEVAQAVAERLPDADALEIQKAHVRIAGGHLCSQTRHYCIRDGVPIDDHQLVMRSRTSNALDYCILIQGLVPLLEAYERSLHAGDVDTRIEMAGAICQGISADPELLVNRLELLGPYSMIENVFVAADDRGRIAYTPLALRHLQLLERYASGIGRVAKPLLEDCAQLRPVEGACSPYGVIFGTATNLIEDMALKTVQLDVETRFSLEDVFVDSDPGGAKLAWVNGWRELPHVGAEVRRLYSYPHPFAAGIFDRVEKALRRRAAAGERSPPPRAGRLAIVAANDPLAESSAAAIPDLPIAYVRSSDEALVRAHKALHCDLATLLNDRQEGHFAVSFQTADGWAAIVKGFLTEILGEGRDARVAWLPPEAATTLRLMCPGLVAPSAPAGPQ
jgi:hypothetical protein